LLESQRELYDIIEIEKRKPRSQQREEQCEKIRMRGSKNHTNIAAAKH